MSRIKLNYSVLGRVYWYQRLCMRYRVIGMYVVERCMDRLVRSVLLSMSSIS